MVLFTDDLDQHALAAAAIEFAVEDLFPGTEIELAAGDGNDDLAALSARIDRTNELLQRMLAEVAKTPSTHAIFVDAGYLYAAAGRLVSGTEDRRTFDLDTEETEERIETLLKLTERYCVVLQTLRNPPAIAATIRGGPAK